jgi:glyoxylase-like metal-dependent hydrolase (beta-lactamase superfamily II)
MSEVTVTELRPGIHRVTHPLPFALNHVHCYVVDGDDGLTVFDAGLGDAAAGTRWAVSRLVLTHFHPDHVGGGAALVDVGRPAEVLQGRLDAEICREAWSVTVDTSLERHMEEHGMPADARAGVMDERTRLPIHPATPTRVLDEGDEISLAGETFRVLVLPGHADGHVALLGTDTGILFAGDVVLDPITPNIGLWWDADPDPLASYLGSMQRLQELDPSVAYPGHRRMIEDVPARAAAIVEHHQQRLEIVERAVRGGATSAYEVAVRVWGDALGPHEIRFGVVEALAHLVRLEAEGRVCGEGGRWSKSM